MGTDLEELENFADQVNRHSERTTCQGQKFGNKPAWYGKNKLRNRVRTSCSRRQSPITLPHISIQDGNDAE